MKLKSKIIYPKELLLTETEKEVLKCIKHQQEKGRERYKVALSYKQDSRPIRWVEEAIEECADMFQYLVALKLCLQKGKKCKLGTRD